MNFKKLLLLLILFVFILAGCNDSSRRTSPHAYFGGKIVNPTSDFLLLRKDFAVIDTIPLDEENKFGYHLKNVEEGLYSFKHNYETQSIYLVPGDSLLTYVNTLEFNETLHFSGVGAEKNNFIIDLFLENEKTTPLVLDYYKIEPSEFERVTDSIKQDRQNRLQELVEENEISEGFVSIAEKIIQYGSNNLRERYTYLVKKYYPEFSDGFPESFFHYREDVSFSDSSFQSNPVYLRFLENYLINLSVQNCPREAESNDCHNLNDYKNIVRRIEMVDTLSKLPLIKNRLFKRLGSTGMVMGKNRDELLEVLETLQEKNMRTEDFNKLVTLGNIQIAFVPGTNLGNVPLITSEGKEVQLNEFVEDQTIIYLWSIYSPSHHKNQHRKITELREKYPDIDFLGINIDIGEMSAWRNALQKYNYSLDSEYQLGTIKIRGEEVGSDVFKSYLNKLLFLDESGTVLIGDAYLDSPEFETRILEFLNL